MKWILTFALFTIAVAAIVALYRMRSRDVERYYHHLKQESWKLRNADEEDAFRRVLDREQTFREHARRCAA